MFEIQIINYESISHADIVIDGFTTLVGRNHLGKSSTLRAINAALTNQQGTEFIKWGETFCEVRIKCPKLDILWHKEEGNNFYKVNGIEYKKVGRDDPPKEILEAGFKPVVVSDHKINLNYAVQFFPLFLVDKLDSKGADLLTSVYGLDRLYKAIELCNKEQKSTSSALKLREKDLSQVKKNLERFQNFPEILDNFEKLKHKKETITEEEIKIDKLKEWNKLIRNLHADFTRLKPVLNTVIPDGSTIILNIEKYYRLIDFKHEYDRLLRYIKRLSPVVKIEIPKKFITEIKDLFLEYKNLINWNKRYKHIENEIKNLEKVKDITLPKPSINTEEIEKLRNYHDELNFYTGDLKGIKKDIKDTEDQIFYIKSEIKEFNICPLCGNPLRGDDERT